MKLASWFGKFRVGSLGKSLPETQASRAQLTQCDIRIARGLQLTAVGDTQIVQSGVQTPGNQGIYGNLSQICLQMAVAAAAWRSVSPSGSQSCSESCGLVSQSFPQSASISGAGCTSFRLTTNWRNKNPMEPRSGSLRQHSGGEQTS
jgi:hypothetical protein